jgi:hypothetical protein
MYSITPTPLRVIRARVNDTPAAKRRNANKSGRSCIRTSITFANRIAKPSLRGYEALASRPVDLTDLGDRAFALGVIEGWVAQVGTDKLPLGISELADALRGHEGRPSTH